MDYENSLGKDGKSGLEKLLLKLRKNWTYKRETNGAIGLKLVYWRKVTL